VRWVNVTMTETLYMVTKNIFLVNAVAGTENRGVFDITGLYILLKTMGHR